MMLRGMTARYLLHGCYPVKSGDTILVHAHDLFEVVQKGAVRIEIGQSYPLAEVAQAHRDMEGRKTTGSTILIP